MQIRVASVPHSQVYIRHLGPVPGDEQPFVRLADPRPRRGDGTEQSGWWPPAMLEPGWIDEHAGEFDLMHVHFGFDALDADDLHRVVADLRRHGKPLVYTVHDLHNPHHSDPTAHDAALDVLVPAADALVTLTPGAADAVRHRWNREALVLPHPHVVDLDELARRQDARVPGSPRRLGVHLKSLRPNMAAREVVDGLLIAAGEVASEASGGVVVQVNTHPEVMQDAAGSRDVTLPAHLRDLADLGRIDLQVHPYFDEHQLWDHLSGLDASVLPYRWGTHSGWLEACVDLGTAVIAPDCGFYAQQREVFGYHLDRDGLDQQTLTDAVRAVVSRDSYPRLTLQERVAERRVLCAEHDRLYRSLLS